MGEEQFQDMQARRASDEFDQRTAPIDNPVEFLLMIIAQYRDSDINHKGCRFRRYPDWNEPMDDRCEACKLADEQLGRPIAPPEGEIK